MDHKKFDSKNFSTVTNTEIFPGWKPKGITCFTTFLFEFKYRILFRCYLLVSLEVS